MDRFTLGILVLVVCSSCSVYRYDVLNSNIAGTPDEPFTFEDDTLRLKYSFPNGVTTVEIFNKSADPLYLDWSRSATITDGISTSYGGDYSPVSFIPPRSRLTQSLFNVVDYTPVERRETIEQRYTRQSSPLKFRSYLLLSFDQDFYESFAMDHTFWLAERRQTKEAVYTKQKQNTYSTAVTTKEGHVAAGVIGVLCAIPIVWIWHQLTYVEEY